MCLSPRASLELRRTSEQLEVHMCPGTCGRIAAFMARAKAAVVVLHGRAGGEKKYLRLKQMKSKQGNCVSSAATGGGTGEKGIPKERLALTTDSEVTSDIKNKLISWGKAAATGLGPGFA